jgi:membrane protein DedA with SNARE-associated domain
MEHVLETWGYVAIFVLTAVGSACIPVPSEITLGFGGALASGATFGSSHTHLRLVSVILVAIAGSLVGCAIAYVVGRTGGRALVERLGKYVLLSSQDLDRSEAWFKRRGDWAVLIGNLIPFVRAFISLPAGIGDMPVARFGLFTTVAVSLWATALAWTGYALGADWHSLVSGVGDAGYVAAGLAVLGVLGAVGHRWRRFHADRAASPGDS